MNKNAKIIKFLQQNIPQNPGKILDVCCGYGRLVKGLSSTYSQSEVYGLDIQSDVLADGIAKGNFKRAIPILGNAYELGKRKPNLFLVSLDPRYHRLQSCYRRDHLEEEKLKETLNEFDLVTAVNPVDELSQSEVIKEQTGELERGSVPVDVIAKPAKVGSHILYENEIAHSWGWCGLTPADITEEVVEKILNEFKKEGEKKGLECLSHRLINESYTVFGGPSKVTTVDLAVLFKKS